MQLFRSNPENDIKADWFNKNSQCSIVTDRRKMQHLILLLSCTVWLMACTQAFFLNNRDLRRIFRLAPTPEIEPNIKNRVNRVKPQNYEHLSYPENFNTGLFDRHDSEDNINNRVPKPDSGLHHHRNHQHTHSNNKKTQHHHPHAGCEHHHHYDAYVEKQEKRKHDENGEENDYYEKKSHRLRDPPKYRDDGKKRNERKEEEHSESDKNQNKKYNKDYITGVLVTIPKIKNANHEGNYFKTNKENSFLQEFANEEEETHDHHHQDSFEPENIGSYIY